MYRKANANCRTPTAGVPPFDVLITSHGSGPMDRLPGTVAPASLVASPSYARAVLPAARAVLTLSSTELNTVRTSMAGRQRRLFLTTCLDDSKPYMSIVALIKGFQNHIGFAIIRASGEE